MMIGAHAVRVHTCSTEKVIIMNLAWNKQNLSQTRSIHKMRETPVSRSKSGVIYQMRQTPSPERDDGINLHISACIEQRAPWSLISAAFWNGGGQKKIINSRRISGIQFLQINSSIHGFLPLIAPWSYPKRDHLAAPWSEKTKELDARARLMLKTINN